ncbi:MAG: hypothetical protein ACF788_13390, partial [Novipirellula sp. JB048]
GQVRMTVEQAGDTPAETKVAPLSVWTNHDTVYLQAYDTRLWSDSKGLTAWIVDPSTRNFDSQVLRAPPIGRRPTLQQLLIDPILVEQVAAGLAGPPPQLEWLFAETPMEQLFLDSHQFEYGEQQTIEQTPCQEIKVLAGDQRYAFWIDTQQGLIRRVDLPSLQLPTTAASHTIRLTLDLREATFAVPAMLPTADSLPDSPQFVGHFVPLPPAAAPSILGTRLDSNRLKTSDRKPYDFAAGSTASELNVTALVYFADDANALNSAFVLQDWSQQLPAELAERVRPVLLLDDAISLRDEVKQILRQSISLSLVWDQSNELASKLAIAPGSLLLVDSAARLVWFQPLVTPESLPTLGAILADALNGVDIPARLQEQHEQDIAAYRRVLREEYADLVARGLVRSATK